jgi:hypothetical protein
MALAASPSRGLCVAATEMALGLKVPITGFMADRRRSSRLMTLFRTMHGLRFS